MQLTIDGENCTDLTTELSKIKFRITLIRVTRVSCNSGQDRT